jgi:hypothetical protein
MTGSRITGRILRRRRARHLAGATDGERGSALVEFALVAILLLTLAFGTVEMGTAWSDSQLVTQAARSGARGSAQLGVSSQSDLYAVQSIEAALGDLAPHLTRIVIYDAVAADGAMPSACVTASSPGISGSCSVYDSSHFANYGAWTDGAWAPSARNNTLDSADHVGVRVEVARPYTTDFFVGATFDISDTTVMRIEPEAGS